MPYLAIPLSYARLERETEVTADKGGRQIGPLSENEERRSIDLAPVGVRSCFEAWRSLAIVLACLYLYTSSMTGISERSRVCHLDGYNESQPDSEELTEFWEATPGPPERYRMMKDMAESILDKSNDFQRFARSEEVSRKSTGRSSFVPERMTTLHESIAPLSLVDGVTKVDDDLKERMMKIPHVVKRVLTMVLRYWGDVTAIDRFTEQLDSEASSGRTFTSL